VGEGGEEGGFDILEGSGEHGDDVEGECEEEGSFIVDQKE
jgi:hypothetical protein